MRALSRRFQGILDKRAEMRRLGTGFQFIEGPVWNPAGSFLLFSDMPADVRRRWDETRGIVEVRRPSNKGNGMAYDATGALIVCEHATSSVVREHVDGSQVLASHYRGRELNSPNDAVVRSDGSVYFTDPNYGRTAGVGVLRKQDLDFQGLYRIDPTGGVDLLRDDFGQPNGLCFSPDESVLYVNDSPRAHLRRFEVAGDGTLSAEKMFFEGVGTPNSDRGAPDGMKCDREGNVFVTGPGGVWIIDPNGRYMGTIEVPEVVGNMNWGGKDWSTLFLAASTSLYCVQTRTAGSPVPGMSFV